MTNEENIPIVYIFNYVYKNIKNLKLKNTVTYVINWEVTFMKEKTLCSNIT